MFGQYDYTGGALGNWFARNTPQSLLGMLFGQRQAALANQPQAQPPAQPPVTPAAAVPALPPVPDQPAPPTLVPQQAPIPAVAQVQQPAPVETYPLLPQEVSSAAGAKQLLDVIAGPESGGRYDVIYGGGTVPGIENMTVDEVRAYQRAHGKRTGSSAIGKYQIISKTMDGLVKKLGLSGNEKFTPELQDRMGMELLNRRGYNKFLQGNLTRDQFAKNLSQEWAGLPKDASGKSYYAGDKMGNAAGIGWNDVTSALDNVKGGVQTVNTVGETSPSVAQAQPGRAPQAPSPYDALRQQIMAPPTPQQGMSPGRQRALAMLSALSQWGGMPDTAGALLRAQSMTPGVAGQLSLKEQLAAMGQLDKMEAERSKRLGRQSWLETLPPDMRALAEAGYGSEVAKQQIQAMTPPEVKDTERQRNYEFMLSQGMTQEEAMERAFGKGGVNITNVPSPPSGYMYANPAAPEEGMTYVPGGPADPNRPKPQTESQAATSGYVSRMTAAEERLSTLEDAPQLQGGTAAWWAQNAPNFLQTSEGQQYQQAANDWIRAKLRKESGAAIADSEMMGEYRTYFPVPGDSQEVIDQKKLARQQAEEAMRLQAGEKPKETSQAGRPEDMSQADWDELQQLRSAQQ